MGRGETAYVFESVEGRGEREISAFYHAGTVSGEVFVARVGGCCGVVVDYVRAACADLRYSLFRCLIACEE